MSKLIDLTGKKFNYLTVIQRGLNTNDGRAQWVCKCDCGNIKTIRGKDLRNGKVKSCGCLQKRRASEANTINEIGNIYGYLTVLKQATKEECPNTNLNRDAYWICSCSNCGNPYFIANAHSLRSGHLNSCGCINSKHENIIKQLLIKNKYCFEHNIPLIRIPYNKEYTFEDLKLETTHFLLTPENEQKYYQQGE